MNYLSSSTYHTTTQPIITTTTHQSSSSTLSSSSHPLPPLIKLKDFIRTGQGNFLEYLFWTDNTALGDISSRFSILVVFILILLIRKIKYRLIPFFSSIGKELAEKGRPNGKEWVRNPANQIRIEKFGEYCFRLIYHSLLSLYGVYFNFGHYLWSYYKQKEILFDDIQPQQIEEEEEEEYYIWSWSSYPGEAIKPAIAWYFLIQFAYHLEALITQIMISFQASDETRAGTGTANNNLNNNSNTQPLSSSHNNSSNNRNSYYYNTLLYHLVANVVIFFYSNARLTKFGSFVILLHNISDVPVDLSKLANFMKWKRATVISIIILVFFWCYTRLLIMPSIVYRSVISLFQQKIIMDTEEKNENNWYYNTNDDDEQQIQQQQEEELVESRNFLFYYRLFCFFSVGITVIHFAWFIMFLKMSYVLVTNVKEIDVFEEEEQEEYYEERKEDGGHGDDLLLSTTTTTREQTYQHQQSQQEQEETLEDSERRKKDN